MSETKYCPKCGVDIPDWRINEQVSSQPRFRDAVDAGEVRIVPTCSSCGWFEGLDEVVEGVNP